MMLKTTIVMLLKWPNRERSDSTNGAKRLHIWSEATLFGGFGGGDSPPDKCRHQNYHTQNIFSYVSYVAYVFPFMLPCSLSRVVPGRWSPTSAIPFVAAFGIVALGKTMAAQHGSVYFDCWSDFFRICFFSVLADKSILLSSESNPAWSIHPG